MRVFRITALQPGVERMGVEHPERPVDHPITRFHPEAAAKLKADRRLKVEEVDVPASKPATEAEASPPAPRKSKASGKR